MAVLNVVFAGSVFSGSPALRAAMGPGLRATLCGSVLACALSLAVAAPRPPRSPCFRSFVALSAKRKRRTWMMLR